MQKLINVVALLSGLTSLGLIGGSAYLLMNKDALIDQAKSAAAKAGGARKAPEIKKKEEPTEPKV